MTPTYLLPIIYRVVDSLRSKLPETLAVLSMHAFKELLVLAGESWLIDDSSVLFSLLSVVCLPTSPRCSERSKWRP